MKWLINWLCFRILFEIQLGIKWQMVTSFTCDHAHEIKKYFIEMISESSTDLYFCGIAASRSLLPTGNPTISRIGEHTHEHININMRYILLLVPCELSQAPRESHRMIKFLNLLLINRWLYIPSYIQPINW